MVKFKFCNPFFRIAVVFTNIKKKRIEIKFLAAEKVRLNYNILLCEHAPAEDDKTSQEYANTLIVEER